MVHTSDSHRHLWLFIEYSSCKYGICKCQESTVLKHFYLIGLHLMITCLRLSDHEGEGWVLLSFVSPQL